MMASGFEPGMYRLRNQNHMTRFAQRTKRIERENEKIKSLSIEQAGN